MKIIQYFILSLVFVIGTQDVLYAQYFSKTFTNENDKFFKTIIKADDEYVTYTFGNSPRVLFLNKSGEITKEIAIPENLLALYCLEYLDGKIYLGGKNKLEEAELIILDKKGNISLSKSYPFTDISAIHKVGNHLYLGGRKKYVVRSYAMWVKTNDLGNMIWKDSLQINSQSRAVKFISKNESIYALIASTTVGVGYSGLVYCKLQSFQGGHEKILEYASGRGQTLIDYDLASFPMDATIFQDNVLIACASNETIDHSGSILFYINPDDKEGNKIKLNSYNKRFYPTGVKYFQEELFVFGYSQIDNKTSGFIQARKQNGELLWNKHFDSIIPHNILFDNQSMYVVGSNRPYFKRDSIHPVFSRLSLHAEMNASGIHFSANEVVDCYVNPTSALHEPLPISVNGSNYIIPANEGLYIDLPSGMASVSITPPLGYSLCNPMDTIFVTENIKDHIFKLKRDTCQELTCGITSTDLVLDQWSKLYFTCVNHGGKTHDSVKILVKSTLDLQSLQSSFPYSKISQNEVLFNLGLLSRGQNVIVDLSVFVDKNAHLFTTQNFEVRIVDLEFCPSKFSLYEGPSFSGELVCQQNNEATLVIQNTGGKMLQEKNYSIYKDGYFISSHGFLLDKNETLTQNLEADGSKIDVVIEADEANPYRKYTVVSLEGCGRFENNYFSKGASVHVGHEDESFHSSFIPLEIRNQETGNRIFETNLGAGYYHMVTESKSNYEYVLRYVNESQTITHDMVIYLDLSSKFDLHSFRPLAYSHNLTYDAIDNWLVIRIHNSEIIPGEEFQMRFYVETKSDRQDITFIDMSAYAWINGQNYIGFNSGFHNVRDEVELKTQSPVPYTPKGQIIGKHNALDFYNDICVLEDDSKLLATNLSEASVSDLSLIYLFDKNEKLVWEKTYIFDKGKASFYKIVAFDENNILLFGTMSDNSLAYTYNGQGYFIILSINKNGEKNWEKIWRTDDVPSLGGGSINFAYKQQNRIVFGGVRYTYSGRKHYYSSVDIHGNISQYYDFKFQYEFYTNQSQDGIVLVSVDDMKPNIYFDYIIINDINKPPITGSFSYRTNTFEMVDVSLENDNIVLLGYKYDLDNFINLTNLLKCNINTKETVRMDINLGFDISMYMNPSKLYIHDSEYYIAGEHIIKEPYSVDVIFAKFDSLGNVKWHFTEDFKSREYSSQIYLARNTFFIGFQTQSSDLLYNLQCGYYKIIDEEISSASHTSFSAEINIFPNPTTSFLIISTDKTNLSSYKIFDATGKLITNGSDCNYIDISFLSNGQYLLVLYDEMLSIYPKPFTKM